MCNEQVQQLEKKLREGTDQNQTSVPPVRGKWSAGNNPHEERYQSKLQDIQKERRAAIEVSLPFLSFLTCAIKIEPTRNNTQTGVCKLGVGGVTPETAT